MAALLPVQYAPVMLSVACYDANSVILHQLLEEQRKRGEGIPAAKANCGRSPACSPTAEMSVPEWKMQDLYNPVLKDILFKLGVKPKSKAPMQRVTTMTQSSTSI